MVKTKHNKEKKKKSIWDETQHPTNRHRRTKSHVNYASEELQNSLIRTQWHQKTETWQNTTSLTGQAST